MMETHHCHECCVELIASLMLHIIPVDVVFTVYFQLVTTTLVPDGMVLYVLMEEGKLQACSCTC